MDIIFATKNKGKLKEFRHLVKELGIHVLSLSDVNFDTDITEDGSTYSENALKKAIVLSKFSNKISVADDSGIEILAFSNAPGIESARFLPELSYEEKFKKIITEMEGIKDEGRTVKYRCAIAICTPGGKSFVCEGECEGIVANAPKGNNGFGYDPLFFLPEYGKTFAELPVEVKNRTSHRARAFKKAKDILTELMNSTSSQ